VWWNAANCQGVGVEIFFGPMAGETVTVRKKRENEAKKICEPCTVKVECLASALKFGDDGIRGGLTRFERNQRAPTAQILDEWVLIARSAGISGHSVLEQTNPLSSRAPRRFRVRIDNHVVKETTDESEAWIALHLSDL